MAVAPLRWQGATRTQQLRDVLQRRTNEWLGDWSVSGGEDVRFEPCGSSPRAAGIETLCVRSGAGRLFAHLPPNFIARLGARLAGISAQDDADDAPALASGIGRRAFDDWMRALTASMPSMEAIDATALGDALGERHGAVHMACTVLGLRWELDVDAALCDALVPITAPTPVRLQQRVEALGPQSVSLEAVLDLGATTLADTLSLAPGDVLRTNLPVTALVELRAPGSGVVAKGALAIVEGRRALRITELRNAGDSK